MTSPPMDQMKVYSFPKTATHLQIMLLCQSYFTYCRLEIYCVNGKCNSVVIMFPEDIYKKTYLQFGSIRTEFLGEGVGERKLGNKQSSHGLNF